MQKKIFINLFFLLSIACICNKKAFCSLNCHLDSENKNKNSPVKNIDDAVDCINEYLNKTKADLYDFAEGKDHLGNLHNCQAGGRKSYFSIDESHFIKTFQGAIAYAQYCEYVSNENKYYCEVDVKEDVCYIDGNKPGVFTRRVLFIVSKGRKGKITACYPWEE